MRSEVIESENVCPSTLSISSDNLSTPFKRLSIHDASSFSSATNPWKSKTPDLGSAAMKYASEEPYQFSTAVDISTLILHTLATTLQPLTPLLIRTYTSFPPEYSLSGGGARMVSIITIFRQNHIKTRYPIQLNPLIKKVRDERHPPQQILIQDLLLGRFVADIPGQAVTDIQG